MLLCNFQYLYIYYLLFFLYSCFLTLFAFLFPLSLFPFPLSFSMFPFHFPLSLSIPPQTESYNMRRTQRCVLTTVGDRSRHLKTCGTRARYSMKTWPAPSPPQLGQSRADPVRGAQTWQQTRRMNAFSRLPSRK